MKKKKSNLPTMGADDSQEGGDSAGLNGGDGNSGNMTFRVRNAVIFNTSRTRQSAATATIV